MDDVGFTSSRSEKAEENIDDDAGGYGGKSIAFTLKAHSGKSLWHTEFTALTLL